VFIGLMVLEPFLAELLQDWMVPRWL